MKAIRPPRAPRVTKAWIVFSYAGWPFPFTCARTRSAACALAVENLFPAAYPTWAGLKRYAGLRVARVEIVPLESHP